jgi:hypothetical protein
MSLTNTTLRRASQAMLRRFAEETESPTSAGAQIRPARTK